jgi:hypothetical protein
MLAQFTLMKGHGRRGLLKWMLPEIKLLPVPVSPVISWWILVWASRLMLTWFLHGGADRK